MSSDVALCRDRLVCRCLQVRESQIVNCVQLHGLETVPEIKSHCGAGGGCTACHRRIRDLISESRLAPESC